MIPNLANTTPPNDPVTPWKAEAALDQDLTEYWRTSGVALVVFTDASLGGESIEHVANETFNEWGMFLDDFNLPDPIGVITDAWERPNGLKIERQRTPLGVIGVIYESRPNVTADAGALCLKAGNAAILRGGSESFHSSGAILECLAEGLKDAGLPAAAPRRRTRGRSDPWVGGQCR